MNSLNKKISNVVIAILFASVTSIVSADATDPSSGSGQWPPNNFCERYGPGGSVPISGGGTLQCTGDNAGTCQAVCGQCCSDGYPNGGTDYSNCLSCCSAYNSGTTSTQHCISSGAAPVSPD